MGRALDGEPAGFGHPPPRGGRSGGVRATATVQGAYLFFCWSLCRSQGP